MKPVNKRIAQLEREIEQTEEQLADNNDALIDASASAASERIQCLSVENHRLKEKAEELYALLEEQLHKTEEITARYERLLQQS
jgi:hypothetical protein